MDTDIQRFILFPERQGTHYFFEQVFAIKNNIKLFY